MKARFLVLAALLAGCGPKLTSEQQEEIRDHGTGLGTCQAVGHVEARRTGDADAGRTAYRACTVDGGLR